MKSSSPFDSIYQAKRRLQPVADRKEAAYPATSAGRVLLRDQIGDGRDRHAIIARTPLRRIGAPSDIAAVVVFLASSDAGWITGETIQVGGGLRL